MARSAVNPGRVDWSGENPGMYLKDQADGPFTGLTSYFRVLASPHGAGHAVVVVSDPAGPAQQEGHVNAVYTDNPELARYLVENFIRAFGPFKPVPGIGDLPIRRAWSFVRSGDLESAYTESADTEDGPITLTWSRLGAPFVVEYMPAQSATGKHEMFSLFVGADQADARVGDVTLQGNAAPRELPGGRAFSTAFLAFAETWVLPEG